MKFFIARPLINVKSIFVFLIEFLYSTAGITNGKGAVESPESSENRCERTANRGLGLEVLFHNLCRRQVICFFGGVIKRI